MLQVGLTGGIGAGKSTVAYRLAELGATVVDADQLAREVVRPASPGLAAVVAEFGARVLGQDGELDRSALAEIVFDDPAARSRLDRILHPLIGARTAEVIAAAPADGIVVQDVPLLVEAGMVAAFPLVVVVDTPEDERVRRLVAGRGMTEHAARARIAAQADQAARLAAADVLLDNSGPPDVVRGEVDRLWRERLEPFEENLRLARQAPPLPPHLAEPDGRWPAQFTRLAARVSRAAGDRAIRVDHIGSTSIPGLPAKDVLDIQLGVRSLAAADELTAPLREAGFLVRPGIDRDNPKPSQPDQARWHKRLFASADPARPVNLHVRPVDSAGFRFALLFRDWLRVDSAARADYLTLKRRMAARCSTDAHPEEYALAKEPWFDKAFEQANRWANETAWRIPSAGSTADSSEVDAENFGAAATCSDTLKKGRR